MSNQTKDFCSCGPACNCAPCVCRQEVEPSPRAACCECGQSDDGKTGCACGY